MNQNIVIVIILAVLGSTGLFTFIQFLISRHDKKKGVIAEIRNDIKELKEANKEERRDLLRIQLMTLIHIHPEDISDVMAVAEEYFIKHTGNWYMSSIFRQYMDENNIEHPIWMREIK